MVKTIMTSIRLYKLIADEIQDFCAKASYRKRSQVINNLLNNVIRCTSPESLALLADNPDAYEDGINIVLTKTKKN